MNTASVFLAKSTVKSGDLNHRCVINFNMGKYNATVPVGKQQFANLEAARNYAHSRKRDAISNLGHYLQQFEEKITARGATVIWAQDAEEARQAILSICREAACKTLVKSKSMVTEEIHLNDFLEKNGIESIETDLGEYIQQLDGEPPYHIVTPAMHKSKEDVARVFAEKLGTPPGLSPQELTQVARVKLREKYVQAEVGVTGANFLLADTGSICITENEGNGRLSNAWPKVHIAITGIEKVLPSINDLQVFWPLLATYGTGQRLTVYNSIISGPRQPGETDGPEQMYVILLDNGRTKLLADPRGREALYCIRCGSCLNACPVYKNIGGHTYDTTYSGPIGKVITPWLRSMHDYKHLSYASSLCGNCTEVCPVKIPLHELLLHNRHEAVARGESTLAERLGWKGWKAAMLSRALMNMAGGKQKSFVINNVFTAWTNGHAPLDFPKKSFSEMYRAGEV